jgi:hypothetical protein
MKSFRKFIKEEKGRKEFVSQLQSTKEVEAARKKLQNIPVLSDAEMRAQNPKATAAYEKEVERKKRLGKSIQTIKTPEGSIVTNMPKGSSTPEEILSRLETKSKAQTKNIVKVPARKTKIKPGAAPKPALKSDSLSKVNLGTYKSPKSSGVTYKPGTANLANLKSVPAKATKSAASVSRTQSIASTLKDVLKTQRDAKAAQRAAFATGAKKTLGNIGKVAGLVGAGLEAKSGYDTARAQGASKKTAAATGGLKAAGALAGGAIGGALGGVLGVPGAIGGSVAGYTLGTKAGEAAAKALRGDYAKKFTTKDLQTNVRKAVPYSVRSQIPGQVRKGFSDFVTQAGKTYGQWSKSQSKGGNK